LPDNKKVALVSDVASRFEKTCVDELRDRLESLYVVGSYAFGRISLDRPDLNFLLIFKGNTTAQDYLKIGKICRKMIDSFKDACSIRIEFRPFRFLYPKIRRDFDVFLNPIIFSTDEIRTRGIIFSKWFTEGMKSGNKLLYGSDPLNAINVSPITHQDLLQVVPTFDVPFETIPLTRAPAQYDEDESDLLLNEALTNAKDLSYLGVEIAMTDEELKDKKYIQYIQNKELMTEFYAERYDQDTTKLVETIIDTRENYLKYKADSRKAEEMLAVALKMADAILRKLFSPS
jgi:hypothetical protein